MIVSPASTEELVAYALQLSAGLVFLAASLSKLVDRAAFRTTVAEYAVLPKRLVAPSAYVLPVLEGIAGLGLISGYAGTLAFALALGLLAAFSVGISINLRRGRRIPCGCFGGRTDTISRRSLARIGLVSGALLAGLLIGWAASTAAPVVAGGTEPAQRMIEAAALATFFLVAGMWLLALPEVLQAVNLRGRLSAERDQAA